MKLPKELTTVTPLSKILAIIIFIALPFVGFLFGIKYQQLVSLHDRQEEEVNRLIAIQRTPTPEKDQTIDTSNWKTYTDTKYKFTFKYPDAWISYTFRNPLLSEDYTVFSNEKVTTYNQLSDKGVILVLDTNVGKINFGGWKKIKLDHREAFRQSFLFIVATPYEPSNSDKVVISDMKISLSLTSKYSKAIQNNEYIFDQILSTFKFTE